MIVKFHSSSSGVVLWVLFCVYLFSAACSDERRQHLNSGDTAEADELRAKGWLPTDLPGNANDVDLIWNLDTNAHCGVFSYDAEWQLNDYLVLKGADHEIPRLCKELERWPKQFPAWILFGHSKIDSHLNFAQNGRAKMGYFWTVK
jgi:hypothetical protein